MYNTQFSNPYANPYAMGQVAANRLAQMPQPMANPYAQLNTTPQQSDLQFVNGRESVDVYPMAPNSKVLLMDSTMARFYIKQTDASGMATVTAYDFTPASEKPAEEYVTRAEFEEWKASHEPTVSAKPAAKRTRKSEPSGLSSDDDS